MRMESHEDTAETSEDRLFFLAAYRVTLGSAFHRPPCRSPSLWRDGFTGHARELKACGIYASCSPLLRLRSRGRRPPSCGLQTTLTAYLPVGRARGQTMTHPQEGCGDQSTCSCCATIKVRTARRHFHFRRDGYRRTNLPARKANRARGLRSHLLASRSLCMSSTMLAHPRPAAGALQTCDQRRHCV